MALKDILTEIAHRLEGDSTELLDKIERELPDFFEHELSDAFASIEQATTAAETAPAQTPTAPANPAGGIPVGGLHPDASAETAAAPAASDTLAPPVSDTGTDTDSASDRSEITNFVQNASPEELAALAGYIGATWPTNPPAPGAPA